MLAMAHPTASAALEPTSSRSRNKGSPAIWCSRNKQWLKRDDDRIRIDILSSKLWDVISSPDTPEILTLSMLVASGSPFRTDTNPKIHCYFLIAAESISLLSTTTISYTPSW